MEARRALQQGRRAKETGEQRWDRGAGTGSEVVPVADPHCSGGHLGCSFSL